MIPPVRVAIAKPVATPANSVADQVGTTCRVMAMIASIAHVIAARNGTSIGVKYRLP